MKDFAVVVSGVGGNVGQGVARILRAVAPKARIIGTNTESVSGGNHLCAALHAVPFATDAAYKDAIREIVRIETPALLIPCTDYETYALASLAGSLPPVGVSAPNVAATFLDKWKTFEAFTAAGLPFARSTLPSRFEATFSSVMVKPREGRGSRDLHLNPEHPEGFDDSFVVQEHMAGDELTIAAYVTRTGVLHGFIVLRRFLEAGATRACETTFRHDRVVEGILRGLVNAIPIRGPFNVQAIARPDGSVVPFEVNGRVSGTASVRHHFGFKDVEYLLNEHVLNEPLAPVEITPGSAVRYLADAIYPGIDLSAPRDHSTPHFIF